jgi:hypothetical protein
MPRKEFAPHRSEVRIVDRVGLEAPRQLDVAKSIHDDDDYAGSI